MLNRRNESRLQFISEIKWNELYSSHSLLLLGWILFRFLVAKLALCTQVHFIWQIYWIEFVVNYNASLTVSHIRRIYNWFGSHAHTQTKTCTSWNSSNTHIHRIKQRENIEFLSSKHIFGVHVFCLCFIVLTIAPSDSVWLMLMQRIPHIYLVTQCLQCRHTHTPHLHDGAYIFERWIVLWHLSCLSLPRVYLCVQKHFTWHIRWYLSFHFLLSLFSLCQKIIKNYMGYKVIRLLFMAYIPFRLPTEPF